MSFRSEFNVSGSVRPNPVTDYRRPFRKEKPSLVRTPPRLAFRPRPTLQSFRPEHSSPDTSPSLSCVILTLTPSLRSPLRFCRCLLSCRHRLRPGTFRTPRLTPPRDPTSRSSHPPETQSRPTDSSQVRLVETRVTRLSSPSARRPTSVFFPCLFLSSLAHPPFDLSGSDSLGPVLLPSTSHDH